MFKAISAIGYILAFPVRLIKTFLSIPNMKILYKSGNSVKIFVKTFNVKFNNEAITEAEWETLGGNKIVYINVDDIEAIFKIW